MGISATPGRLTLDVDFVLTPAHPSYRDPPADERECFRRGKLRFIGVRMLCWENQGAPPATDATGESDFGHIDDLEWGEGVFELNGDWGQIRVLAEDVSVDLEP
jgi:hypothetical protein